MPDPLIPITVALREDGTVVEGFDQYGGLGQIQYHAGGWLAWNAFRQEYEEVYPTAYLPIILEKEDSRGEA